MLFKKSSEVDFTGRVLESGYHGLMNKEIHATQAHILKELLLRKSARFSDLKPESLSSDQFTFHLKKLVDEGVAKKLEDGSYELTHAGKEFANRFDTDSGPVKLERQAKLGVLVVAFREKEGVREYVMQQRLKHPFFGFRGFITGKIKWGESVVDGAARELEEETGLVGDITHQSIYHELIYSPSRDLLEDKYFFICTAENLKGNLLTEFEGGRNEWAREEDFLKEDVFYDISDSLALTKKGAPKFSEKSYTVEKY